MPKVIIVSATSLESDLLKANIEDNGNNYHYHVTGVGMMHTAVELYELIIRDTPSFIIQAGIAGSFCTSLKLGEAVLIDEETICDIGVFEDDSFLDLNQIGLTSETGFRNNYGNIKNPLFLENEFVGLKIVSGGTVNCISTNFNFIGQMRQRKISIESMEGAALHFVCNRLNQPYLQIRGISNYVGERDKSRWEIKTSLLNVAEVINRISSSIKKFNRVETKGQSPRLFPRKEQLP